MGERPRVPGGQEHKRPARSDKPRLGRRMPNARAERGVALITVLIAVSFVSIIVIACITLVTMAARTTSWSIERTKALYAAEAGINRWLFEASIEQTRSGHGNRHGQGGNARGHTHRRGAGSGKGGSAGSDHGAHGTDSVENLEVSGEINGIPYVAKVDGSPSQDVYRVVSVAQTASRRVTVAVTAELVPEAWKHVVCARDPWYTAALRWFLTVNETSQYQPSSGANGAVWLPKDDRDFVPVPEWGYEGLDGYWFRVGLPWTPPLSETEIHVTGGVVSLEGEGPFYIRKCKERIKELRTLVDGDLYIEDCSIDKISGHVTGDIVVRNTGKDKGVSVITGRVDGSICIDSSQASPSDDWPISTTIGSRETPTTVGGSVYLRGRPPGILRDVLVILGPNGGGDVEGTSIGAGVFADEACIYVRGKVNIQKTQSLPAILASGFAILDGTSGNIRVDGPVYSEAKLYSEAKHAFSLLDLRVDIPGEINKWLDNKGLGILMIGDNLRGEGSPSITIKGNIVSPGSALLVGNVLVTYDRQLLLSPPPLFVGGKRVTAPIAGTWFVSQERATE